MSKIRVTLADKDVRSMRSVREVLKMLQDVRTQIADIVSPIETMFEALARREARAAGGGFNITGPKRNIKVQTEVKAPNKSQLEQIAESWAKVQELHEKKQFLDRTIVHIDANYRTSKDFAKLKSAAKLARDEAVQGLQKLQDVMDKLGARHVPRHIMRFVEKVDNELQENIHFKKSRRRIYIAPSPDTKAPTFYAFLSYSEVQLEDAESFEPEYHVLFTAQPEGKGFAYFLNTTRRFELPHKTGLGKRLQVDDELDTLAARRALKIIQQQMDIDHIFVDFRNPFPEVSVPKIAGIKRTEVADDFLYIYCDKTVGLDQVARITSNILALLQVNNDLTQYQELVPKVTKSPKGLVIRYSIHALGRAGREQMLTVNQMAELRDFFGFSDTQMRAFKQALKSD